MGRTACTQPQCLYKGALYLTFYSIKSYVRLYNYVFCIAGCHIPRLTKAYFTGYIYRRCRVQLYIALSYRKNS
jgi:hypothetical protein